MRTIKNYIYLAIALAGFTSCATVKVEKPLEAYGSNSFKAKPSVVSFTTQSKILDIQNELNKSFSGMLYEDNSLDNNGGDNLMVKAWKQGDLKLDMNGNVLSYRVPLKVWLKAGFKVEKFGISLSDYRELNAALALKFKTAVTINKDWTITTVTEPDGYEWLTTPVIKLGKVDMSVKFVADLILKASSKKVGTMIDGSIKDYLNIKPYAQQAWDLMSKPVKLNDEYNVWLKLSPQTLVSSPLTATNGMIRHQAGVISTIELSMGEAPLANVTKPLPSLLIGQIPTDKATLYAYINLPFDEINKQANKLIVGKTFEQGKKKVTLDMVRVYGSNGKLIAETQLSGSFKGTLYFSGTPAYNASDSTLVVNDFDFDVSTKNFLVKSATWLLQDTFKKMISERLKWSIKKEMVMINSTINDNLKSYKLTDGVILSGSVNKLDPGAIIISTNGINCEVTAQGKAGIAITPGFMTKGK